ncbi:jg18722 [Pararge aegeria aegeria]|uniref:Jg18722 protein n=1 Tax=Pararge aegeria aegeria TaxID=348720 RepID=A0A8S4RP50_9NEOP|nr:jg18722 [Pararge aegeria aegeria]
MTNYHPSDEDVPRSDTMSFRNLLYHRTKFAFPSSVFPDNYYLGTLKSRVNRHLIGKSAPTQAASSLTIRGKSLWMSIGQLISLNMPDFAESTTLRDLRTKTSVRLNSSRRRDYDPVRLLPVGGVVKAGQNVATTPLDEVTREYNREREATFSLLHLTSTAITNPAQLPVVELLQTDILDVSKVLILGLLELNEF